MDSRGSKFVPVLGRVLSTLGVVAVIAIVVDLSSGGELLRFAQRMISDVVSTSDPTTTHTPSDPADAHSSSTGTPVARPEAWSCSYEATLNDNWHDDVICRSGLQSFRPTLLPDSPYVTEAEMRAAGEAYESELNG